MDVCNTDMIKRYIKELSKHVRSPTKGREDGDVHGSSGYSPELGENGQKLKQKSVLQRTAVDNEIEIDKEMERREATNMIRGVPKEVAEMKNELKEIEEFINCADRMAEAEEDNTHGGIKLAKGEQPHDPGCAALLPKTGDFLKTMSARLQIAYKIQNVKSLVNAMEDTTGKGHGFQIQSFPSEGSSSSAANRKTTLNNLRKAPFYIEEVVEFEAPREDLISWLVRGREERTVVSVVEMGGQGKTTLAKKVFDSEKVIGHFGVCRLWITVSQSYTVDGLLRDMLQKFYKQKGDNPPPSISEMDRDSLIDEVRCFLQNKRYFILFDDAWDGNFWNEFEYCLIDSKKGSRILITTRKINVATSCRRSSLVQVHELKPLNHEYLWSFFLRRHSLT
ncbi:disease resistance protein rpm1-like [Trifolium pratense]|uniref:Disease resistance protein rpm1-like n=1 Tax=Trifolium pratense TaxID=57577 RepID=A0A2K3NRJ8_TRIPR|nr:disease resistance protein rpm1-like [Trifolium pratense]